MTAINGDQAKNGLNGSAWQTVFPDYREEKLSDSGQRHVGLMDQFKDNAHVYSAIYDPKVVLINIGSNE